MPDFLFKLSFAILVFVLCWACSDSGVNADGEKSSTQKYFFLSPNVHQLCDSVDERISKEGVRTRLSPDGKYTLVAFNDSLDVEPLLFIDGVKCCENGCRGTRNGDSLQFSFSCKLDEPMYAILSLKDLNGDFIKNPFHNVLLEGMGVYSDHLSLNLIVAGSFDSTADGKTIDSLVQRTGRSLQALYDVQVDSIYISYAEKHPLVGNLYKKKSFLVVDGIPDVDNLSEPWNDPGKDNAFDVVLVNGFTDASMVGCAKTFFWQGFSKMNVVIVSLNGRDGSPRRAKGIQNTIIHEMGHFFGLSHTTLTMDDLFKWGDFSVFDDGLEDTPYCKKMIENDIKELKSRGLIEPDYSITFLNDDNVSGCPDEFNIMYSYADEASYWGARADVYRESSPMQRAIVKKNLTLIPH